MKKIVVIAAICLTQCLQAQESLMFKMNYSIGVPLSQTSYLKEASYRGFGLGFGKIFNTNVSLSLDATWNHFYQYEPRQTYYFEGGAITTDLYKYRQQVPIVLTMNYIFLRDLRFKVYAGMGLGLNYVQDKIFFNAYNVSDENFGFNMQPKAGATFAIDEYERFHLFTECSFNYSTNRSEDLKYNSLSGLLIGVGGYLIID